MLHNTRGIVFRQVKYSETSLIVKIYTRLFGIQSYIIRGIRSKKSAARPALLQPLTPVDLIVYRRENKDIQQLKEIKIAFPLKTIPFDIRKSSVVVFLNEILNNVINEEEPNPDLFDFLYQSVQDLDNIEKGISGYHLLFLLRLSRHLGFFPNNNYSEQEPVFNLQEGKFTHQQLPESHGISLPYSAHFSSLINFTSAAEADFHLSAAVRSIMLDSILRYYYFHVPGMKGIKSHLILQTVLND